MLSLMQPFIMSPVPLDLSTLFLLDSQACILCQYSSSGNAVVQGAHP